MSEEQDTSATTEVTADQADTQESQADSEAGGSQEAPKQEQTGTGFDLVVPEGYSMDDSATKEFGEFAQEIGVDQEKAQKMLDRHLDSLGKALGRDQDSLKGIHESWASESMNDKEFGGTSLAENIVGARKVMNSFSSPATDGDGKPVLHPEGVMKGQQMTKVEVLLNQTGMGNHPEMIRIFHRISKAISEDTFVQGDMKPTENKKTHADIMYGESHK
jgi:hypothetical protein